MAPAVEITLANGKVPGAFLCMFFPRLQGNPAFYLFKNFPIMNISGCLSLNVDSATSLSRAYHTFHPTTSDIESHSLQLEDGWMDGWMSLSFCLCWHDLVRVRLAGPLWCWLFALFFLVFSCLKVFDSREFFSPVLRTARAPARTQALDTPLRNLPEKIPAIVLAFSKRAFLFACLPVRVRVSLPNKGFFRRCERSASYLHLGLKAIRNLTDLNQLLTNNNSSNCLPPYLNKHFILLCSIFTCVPEVAAAGPGQSSTKRVDQVENSPSQDNTVHSEIDLDNHGVIPNPCK